MKRFLPVLVFFSTHLISHAQGDLTKGLVAYYPFTGNANDQSGKGNHAVSNNATLTEDRFGNKNAAYYFNGKDNFMRIKNNASLSPDEITLFAIIKPLGFYQGDCYNNSIIDKGDYDYRPGTYALRFTAGEYTHGDCKDGDSAHQNFVGMVSDNGGKTSNDIYVELGKWYYITFTFNKDHCRLFLDGELITSFGSKSKLGKTSQDIFFGHKDNPKFPYWFKGIIDEIRIYNRALTTDEVYELYTELSKN